MLPEIISAGGRHVTVKESSGILSVYHNWEQFFQRPDADDLCTGYLAKLRELTTIVTLKMLSN
jgi:hypothetical protein